MSGSVALACCGNIRGCGNDIVFVVKRRCVGFEWEIFVTRQFWTLCPADNFSGARVVPIDVQPMSGATCYESIRGRRGLGDFVSIPDGEFLLSARVIESMSSYLSMWGRIVPVVLDGEINRYFNYLAGSLAALEFDRCSFVYSPVRRNVAISAASLVFNCELDPDAIFYPSGVSFPHGYFVGRRFVESVGLRQFKGVYFRSWVDGQAPAFLK